MNQDKTGINPWLKIAASDYENHMDSPNVGQLTFLNNLFKDTLKKYNPGSLFVPGCTTGNGFENIDFNITKKILAVDINPEYIKILRERFRDKLDKIETVCTDLNDFDLGKRKFDLVHCALIFEYVDGFSLIDKIKKSLNNNGFMTVLLQLSQKSTSAVSESYFSSLKNLEGFIELVIPEGFNEIAIAKGFRKESEIIFTLESGKTFWFGSYRRL
jgi:SAM-dependent methyltransferase